MKYVLSKAIKKVSPFLLVIGIFAAPAIAVAGEEKGDRGASKPGIPYVEGEVLVKFNKGVTPGEIASLNRNSNGNVVNIINELKVYTVRGTRGQSTEALIKAYSRMPQVKYVERNVIYHSTLKPNDRLYRNLWGLHNTGLDGGTADADIDAEEAWDRNTGSSSVIIASIDTGVDYLHEDLANNIWVNNGEIPGNGVDDDGNGYIDDYYGWDWLNDDNDPMDVRGHGTHTSGTMAAEGNNNRTGIVGVSWNAKIMSLKWLGPEGGTAEDASEAIIYAANMGARISNNSWGCGPSTLCYSQTMEDAIAYAHQKGMLFVTSAGNKNMNADIVYFSPCNSGHESVICVAATDRNDLKASFSNYGATNVDLGAPGVQILSTLPGNNYEYYDGTSMASPHVAGIGAVLLAEYPDLTVDELRDIIISSVDPVAVLDGITVTGGRANLNNALNISMPTVSASPSLVGPLNMGDSFTTTVQIRSLNGYSSPVSLTLESDDSSITGSFSESVVTPAPDGTATSQLTINTTSNTIRGRHILKVKGVDDQFKEHIGTVLLDVVGQDYTVTVSEAAFYVPWGGDLQVEVTVTSYEGYNQPVTLSMTSSDPLLTGTFNPVTVTPIPNGTVTATLNIVSDPAITYGDYWVYIHGADGIKTRTLAVPTTISDMDLIPTSFSGPTGALPGDTLMMYDSILNQGAETTGAYYVGYYLSEDDVITTDDQFIGNRVVTIHPGGATNSPLLGSAVYLSPDQPTGSYYLGMIVDYYDDVNENIESNNTIVGNIININYSDLEMSAVSGPASGETGSQIAVSNTVANSGPGATVNGFNVGIYLSTDATITTTDTLIGTRYVGSLEPGASSTDSSTVNLPQGLSDGTYYIGAIADYATEITESNEANNSLAGNTITITQGAPGAPPLETWVSRHDNRTKQGASLGDDNATDIFIDSSGNVYVTGNSFIEDYNTDYLTVVYDSAGNEVWSKTYDDGGGHYDYAVKIGADDAGNTYVTGYSGASTSPEFYVNYDYATVKYNSSGRELWAARYDSGGFDDKPTDMHVDGAGNVYVTGSAKSEFDNNPDYVTIKYDTSGTELWRAVYHNGIPNFSNRGDNATSLFVDGSGNVFVTGKSFNGDNYDVLTVMYDASGNEVWEHRYDYGILTPGLFPVVDEGKDIVADGTNIYVTGVSYDGIKNDYLLLKYDYTGALQWESRYVNGDNSPTNVALDGSGNIVVTGNSNNGSNNDYATVAYNNAGNQVWESRYDNGSNDTVADMSIDAAGNVYVIGASSNGVSSDYATVKYDSTGSQLWEARHDYGSTDEGNAVTIGAAGEFYVTGASSNGANKDYATIKYTEQ